MNSAPRTLHLLVCAVLVLCVALRAADQTGQVTFTGLPVPGATITATQGEKVVTATSNDEGFYRLTGLADGVWTVKIEMSGFAPLIKDVTIAENAPPSTFELTLLGFDEMKKTATIAVVAPPASAPQSGATAGKPATPATGVAPNAPGAASTSARPAPNAPNAPGAPAGAVAPDAAPPTELDRAAADGFLINGSVNNGAASPFAQARAFGNARNNGRSLYSGALAVVFGSSAWDSRPFSFTSSRGPKPSYNDATVSGQIAGPIKIPGVRNRPSVFLGYGHSVDNTATTQSALMPTNLERAGDFSQSRDALGNPVSIVDAVTGQPFAGNAIPASRISPQAAALLAYYPQPNVASEAGFNFQSPVLAVTRQDNLQTRINHTLNNRNSLSAEIQYQRSRILSTNIFQFEDATNVSTLNSTVNWTRRFSQFFSLRVTYQYLRQTNEATPYFSSRTNVSGLAGIAGNDQEAVNWGPPGLTFTSGLAGLSDGQYTRNHTATHGMSAESTWRTRGRHTVTFGGGARPQAVNVRSQLDPRGRFSFSGASTGSDFADFLLGLPRTSSIAFGNADKRLRGSSLNAYVSDDWRVSPTLTLNLGARWEYEAPFTEGGGRLANLGAAQDFTSVSLVTSTPSSSLIRSDWRGLQPRLAAAWRPVPASSLVIRAGYGIYRNTNVFLGIATLLAQQPPFSKTLSVENTAANPLTLANGFIAPSTGASNTFAIDPAFRVGYAHNWQVSLQRDLPASLTVIATYLGTKGQHLMQEFVPNTYPAGAANPCATCPTGFVFLTSNGHSTRNSGQLQLRRRLRSGLTASTQYTFSKANDNAASFGGADLSGSAIAQDWRNLDGEWGRSSFDQRHLLATTFEYTTGMGANGGALMTGKKGALYKGWTVTGQLNVGSGLPLTPVYLGSLAGTGVLGAIRANYTGVPIGAVSSGYYLNPAAFAPPGPGQWGTAARNSITGPGQFSFNMGLARTMILHNRLTFEWHMDATNVLNRVTYSGVNTTVSSLQFGLPNRANQMRKLTTNLRMRF